MTFQGDPYRALGISPGASPDQIRAAYRRLAKRYHPDAAGERALPRFLAIQAAYERLLDDDGRLRSGSGEPWRADATRARASREAWRARRHAEPGGTGSAADSGGGGTAGSPGAAGSRDGTGAADSGGHAAGSGGRAAGDARGTDRHARGTPRRATPGSTTYDEAAETPRDPEWDGGTWYGPSSGTYWTINPREYADPRKHGPEYLARTRGAHGAHGASEEPGAARDAPAARGDPRPAASSRLPPARPRPGLGGRWRSLVALVTGRIAGRRAGPGGGDGGP